MARKIKLRTSPAAVGARIRKLRGALSQVVFAEAVGVNHGLISRYEAGQIYPSVSSLISIADATGVSIDWLVTGQTGVGDG